MSAPPSLLAQAVEARRAAEGADSAAWLPPKGGEKLAATKSPPKKTPAPEVKKPEPAKPDDDKPFDEIVKDMEVIRGLFTFYRKADDNRLLLEIQPDQLDKVFLCSASIDQSSGERGMYSSQVAGEFPFLFRKQGKNIQWVVKNTSFTAEKGTPAARAMERSFADSILGVARVRSKPHPTRHSHLIELNDLLLGDLVGLTAAINDAYRPSAYHQDRNTTYFGAVKSFPENSLLEVVLNFVTDQPRGGSLTLPDARSLPIVLKYDLSALRETGYQPRLADDRVGHFLTTYEDFTSDKPSSPYVRYIHRWQLEKADPKAARSAPKQPIVFWLENTIPNEYRAWFREGVLLWNKAFERIGFRDAIVVKQMPDDADWDPADTRFNTLRWFAGVDASFAIGPSRANPFTGQIYDADIGFSEGIIRSARRFGEEFAGPVSTGVEARIPSAGTRLAFHSATGCEYADGLAQQAALAVNLLEARGTLAPELEEKLMHQYVVEVVAHEVGHTLGLRHNFRASTILAADELMNTNKTAELGQSGSVMDYNPIVLAAKGEAQGDFVTPTLGPYDYWAIEYAYTVIDRDEKAELGKIAAHAPDPLLTYATDEDALGTYSPAAIDPLVNQFDQSSDPLAYFTRRIAIIRELWAEMDPKLVKPGEGYQVLRRTLSRGFGEYSRGVLIVAKYIGGVYFRRDHAGDPDAHLPYEPVPAAKQREALQFLASNAFTDEPFQLPAGLHNKLAVERLPGLGGIDEMFGGGRLDYPWHEAVLGLQRAVLNRLLHPAVLSRIQDNELRCGKDEPPFLLADLFSGLDAAIWSELDRPGATISSFRRNLQREHVKALIRIALRSTGTIEDATTLARASLVRLQQRLQGAPRSADATTQAHLEETHARITAALQAQMQKPWE